MAIQTPSLTCIDTARPRCALVRPVRLSDSRPGRPDIWQTSRSGRHSPRLRALYASWVGLEALPARPDHGVKEEPATLGRRVTFGYVGRMISTSRDEAARRSRSRPCRPSAGYSTSTCAAIRRPGRLIVRQGCVILTVHWCGAYLVSADLQPTAAWVAPLEQRSCRLGF